MERRLASDSIHPGVITATIAEAGAAFSLVDLSLLLAEDLPCSWPDHMPFQHRVFNWFGDRNDEVVAVSGRLGPYHTRWFLMDEHTGTHFDAPSHAVAPPDSGFPAAGEHGLTNADLVPLEQLIGRCVVIDVGDLLGTAAAGRSPLIQPERVEQFQEEIGPVSPGEIVLFRTGWDRYYTRGRSGDAYARSCAAGSAPAWPAPTAETIALLNELGVRCVGTDGVSIGAAHDPASAHIAGLSRGMVYVECLTHLDTLPPRGAWFMFLPLKLQHGSGAPGRAIAFVPAD